MTIWRGGTEVITEKIETHANDRDHRDPEDRLIDDECETDRREKMMDKTLADSFPASDPLSSLPNPGVDSFKARKA